MPKSKITLFFLILGWFSLKPIESRCEIIIKVVDYDSGFALPYSSVLLDKKPFSITDSLGVLTMHDSLLFKSLLVKCLGYFESTLLIDRSSCTVRLKKKNINLDDVVISPKTYSVKLSKYKLGSKSEKPTGVYNFNKGAIVLRFLDYNDIRRHKKSQIYIESVGFYITSQGHPNSNFRIRILSVDSLGSPSFDLLDHNVIVNTNHMSNQWFDIQLERYALKFPPEGVFVGMEWLMDTEIKSYTDTVFGNLVNYDGQVLGGSWDTNARKTWIRSSRSNIWILDGVDKRWFKNLNAMIRGKILVVK